MRAIGCEDGTIRINTCDAKSFNIDYPLMFEAGKTKLLPKEGQSEKWHGPDPDCGIWREYTLYDGEKVTLRVTQLIRHKTYGIEIRFTFYNLTSQVLYDMSFSEMIYESSVKPEWEEPAVKSSGSIKLSEIAPYENVVLKAKITY